MVSGCRLMSKSEITSILIQAPINEISFAERWYGFSKAIIYAAFVSLRKKLLYFPKDIFLLISKPLPTIKSDFSFHFNHVKIIGIFLMSFRRLTQNTDNPVS